MTKTFEGKIRFFFDPKYYKNMKIQQQTLDEVFDGFYTNGPANYFNEIMDYYHRETDIYEFEYEDIDPIDDSIYEECDIDDSLYDPSLYIDNEYPNIHEYPKISYTVNIERAGNFKPFITYQFSVIFDDNGVKNIEPCDYSNETMLKKLIDYFIMKYCLTMLAKKCKFDIIKKYYDRYNEYPTMQFYNSSLLEWYNQELKKFTQLFFDITYFDEINKSEVETIAKYDSKNLENILKTKYPTNIKEEKVMTDEDIYNDIYNDDYFDIYSINPGCCFYNKEFYFDDYYEGESYDELELNFYTKEDLFSSNDIKMIYELMSNNASKLRLFEHEIMLSNKKNMIKKLPEIVIGQDIAIKKSIDYCIERLIFNNDDDKPKAVMMFAGPSGVGKTYLAKNIASSIKYKFKRFDMSEYGGTDHQLEGLVGFEKTWRDSKPGVLTQYVKNNPKSVILFDEIEKASPSIIKLFLQILDGARLTDKYFEETVNFNECIIIFTTNAGENLYKDNKQTNLASLSETTIRAALSSDKNFPPEIISRLASGNIIMFNHLSIDSLLKISQKSFSKAKESIKNSMKLENNNQYVNVTKQINELILLNLGENVEGRTVDAKSSEFITSNVMALWDYAKENNKIKFLDEITNIEFKIDGYENDISVTEILKDLAKDLKSYDDVKNTLRNQEPNILIYGNSTNEEKQEKYSNYFISNEKSIFTSSDINGLTDVIKNWDIDIIIVEEGSDVSFAKQLVKTPVYYLTDKNLPQTKKDQLIKSKITAFLDINDKQEWEDVVYRFKLNKISRKMSLQNMILDYDISYQIKDNLGIIKLFNLRLEKQSYDDFETRKFDKRFFVEEKPKVRMSDVFGAYDVKQKLNRFLNYLKNPEKYSILGLKPPKGLLMYGAPGVGKTMMAKALAYESECEFISTTGTDLNNMGSLGVKYLFERARKKSPCIIFIDEIDTVGKNREGSGTRSEEVLNELLVQMDGFSSGSQLIYIIGATNFYANEGGAIDAALTRRLDKTVEVRMPDTRLRRQFLYHKLNEKYKNNFFNISEEDFYDLVNLASKFTLDMSFNNLENMLNNIYENNIEAMLNNSMTKEMLLDGILEYRFGSKTRDKASDTMVRVAYHEAGHAFLNHYFGNNILFASILSRSNFNGVVVKDLENSSEKTNKQDLLNDICINLAGRASEEVYLGYEESLNMGASSDLSNATNIAALIYFRFGMYKNRLIVRKAANLPKEDYDTLNNILLEQMQRTIEILKEDKEKPVEQGGQKVERLKNAFLENDTLTGEEIKKLWEEN